MQLTGRAVAGIGCGALWVGWRIKNRCNRSQVLTSPSITYTHGPSAPARPSQHRLRTCYLYARHTWFDSMETGRRAQCIISFFNYIFRVPHDPCLCLNAALTIERR